MVTVAEWYAYKRVRRVLEEYPTEQRPQVEASIEAWCQEILGPSKLERAIRTRIQRLLRKVV